MAPPSYVVPDQTNKVVIVTGGNSGIGKFSCQALLAKGARVYLAARNQAKAEEAINEIKLATGKDDIHFLPLDLSSIASIVAGAQLFLSKEPLLHTLYNNAGIMAVPLEITKDGYESQFGTNVIGHFLLIKLLLPVLERTAKQSEPGSVRIINVSSDGHNVAPKGGIVFDDMALTGGYWFANWKRYGQTKLGNILVTNEFVKRYAHTGIVSLSIHPGVVKTNLLGGSQMTQSTIGSFMGSLMMYFSIEVEQGAFTQLYAGTSNDVTTLNLNGAYLVPYGKVGTRSSYAQDPVLATKLWDWLENELNGKY